MFIICSLLMLFICLMNITVHFLIALWSLQIESSQPRILFFIWTVYTVQVWGRDHHPFRCIDHFVWKFPPWNYISPTKTKTKWYLNRYLLDVGVATELFEAALPLSSSIAEMRSNRNLQSRRGSKDVLSAIISPDTISRNTGQGGNSSRKPNVDHNIMWYSCTSRVALTEQSDVIRTIVPQQTTCYK